MNNIKNLKIADISISIDVSNFIGQEIYNELNYISFSNNDNIDITLKFDSFDKKDKKIMVGKNCYFDKTSFTYNLLDFLEFEYKLNENSILLLIKHKDSTKKNKFKNLFFGKKRTEINGIMSYSLFWLFFQLILIQNSKSFLHAGIFANKNNKSIAITGSGGCGKTSTLFKFLENKDYYYLSEDFGIIDNKGLAYYNPKALSIYESDIRYNSKILKKIYKEFSFLEFIKWNIQKNILKINPMKKINPQDLLENRVKNKVKLNKILFFIRTINSNFYHKIISKEELSYKCLNVNLREFKMIYEYYHQYEANKLWVNKLFDIDSYKKSVENLYLNAFNTTENYIVYIPFKSSPEKIINYLEKEGLLF